MQVKQRQRGLLVRLRHLDHNQFKREIRCCSLLIRFWRIVPLCNHRNSEHLRTSTRYPITAKRKVKLVVKTTALIRKWTMRMMRTVDYLKIMMKRMCDSLGILCSKIRMRINSNTTRKRILRNPSSRELRLTTLLTVEAIHLRIKHRSMLSYERKSACHMISWHWRMLTVRFWSTGRLNSWKMHSLELLMKMTKSTGTLSSVQLRYASRFVLVMPR